MMLTKGKNLNPDPYKIISDFILDGQPQKFLLIVPTNRKLRLKKKEIISLSPGQIVAKINIETLSTLSVKLLEQKINKVSLVSEAAASVLLNKSFLSVDLKYFSTYKNEIPRGTLDRIKNVFGEYKRNGIAPAKLLSDSEKLEGSEQRKAEDIAHVYENYQSILNNLEVFEIGDVYRKLIELGNEEFQSSFNACYPDALTVVIEGFNEFSLPEIEIINHIANICNVNLYLIFEYSKNNPSLFLHLDESYNRFLERGFTVIEQELHTENDFPLFLKSNLFKSHLSEKRKASHITEIIAKDIEQEVQLISKEIKQLMYDENIAPSKICVAFNLIEKYSPIIRDRFNLYKIPLNLTDRFSLNSFQPIVTLISLLEIEENNYYYKNVFRTLSSPYLKPQNASLFDIIKVVSDLKIISDYAQWHKSLTSKSFDEYDNDYVKESKELLYKNILKEIDSIKSLLKPFKGKMTIDHFMDALENLIYQLEIPQKILLNGKGYEEENLKALSTFTGITDELFELLKLEKNIEDKFPLSFYLNQIRTAVDASRFNVKEKTNYGVLVTTLNEIRGIEYDYLFIGGLVDGDLPTRYSPEIFHAVSYQKQENKHQAEEQNLFYLTLSQNNKAMYVTHALTDGKKELVQSNFLSSLKNILEFKQKTYAYYENNIDGEHEYLIRIGEQYAKEGGLANLDDGKISTDRFEDIVNGLEIQKNERASPENAGEYQGILKTDNEEIKHALNALKQRNYSITQLETFALCPFKYFADRILKLKPITEPKEEIEAMEIGSLLHSILQEFYVKLKSKNLVLKSCSDEDFIKIQKIIFEIAEEKAGQSNFDSPMSFYEKEKIFGIDNKREYSILFRFINEERANPEGFFPSYFEVPFGKRKNEVDSSEEDLKVTTRNGYELAGKIDRIDLDRKEKTFKVIDYKRGLPDIKPTDIEVGISLQLPLYLYAAKLIIEKKENETYEPAASALYSLKLSKNFGQKEYKIGKKNYYAASDEERTDIIQLNNEMINKTLDKIDQYINAISSGLYNLSTLEDREKKVCSRCDFHGLCRINEVTK